MDWSEGLFPGRIRLQAAVLVYLALGAVFGVAFLARGLEVVDPAARGTGFGFRAILIPGILGLWPYLLLRWVRSR